VKPGYRKTGRAGDQMEKEGEMGVQGGISLTPTLSRREREKKAAQVSRL